MLFYWTPPSALYSAGNTSEQSVSNIIAQQNKRKKSPVSLNLDSVAQSRGSLINVRSTVDGLMISRAHVGGGGAPAINLSDTST